MLVKTIIADLLWEVEFLQGRWTRAQWDWQNLNHQVLHHRLQGELQDLRCRVEHVEGIAQSLLSTAGSETIKLSLLQAICRGILAQDNSPCPMGSYAT